METNSMSCADMAALMNNGGANNWSNNPFMYLIWLAFFGGGNGFGFNRNGQGLQDAEIMAQLNSIRSQMQDNQNTNALQGAIASNHDFLHSFNNGVNMGFAGTNASINNASMTNLMGQKDAQAQMASCCCDIKSNILNQTNQLQSQIAQLANGTQTGFANIGFEIAQQTNALQNTANANTQRILDHMCNTETQSLRDKLAQASQDAQTATLISQLKTTA